MHHDARSAEYYRVELNGSFWPILLKKSGLVSTAEKYALEIEISTLNRGFGAQISRSCGQKRNFQRQYAGSLEGPTFSTQSAVCCLSLVLKITWLFHSRSDPAFQHWVCDDKPLLKMQRLRSRSGSKKSSLDETQKRTCLRHQQNISLL